MRRENGIGKMKTREKRVFTPSPFYMEKDPRGKLHCELGLKKEGVWV